MADVAPDQFSDGLGNIKYFSCPDTESGYMGKIRGFRIVWFYCTIYCTLTVYNRNILMYNTTRYSYLVNERAPRFPAFPGLDALFVYLFMQLAQSL